MTEKIDPKEVEYDEKNDIRRAIKEFSAAMLDRMLEKYDEGLRGWDEPTNKVDIYCDMCDDASDCQVSGDSDKMVDIANRAMMLWRFDKDKK
jgi:hypothetical protein